MLRLSKITLIALLPMVFMASCIGSEKKVDNEGDTPSDSVSAESSRIYEYGVDVTDYILHEGVVDNNEVFGSLMRKLGVADSIAMGILSIPDTLFDVRKMRAGKSYSIYYEECNDSVEIPRYFVYHNSLVESVVFNLTDSMTAHRHVKPTRYEHRVSEFEIKTSLWNAVVDENLDMALVIKMSDIFAWTVDFFGLQQGDKFRVSYDEQFVDSTAIGIGRIYGAVYNNGNKPVYAIWFENDSVKGYWDLEGQSVKKAFLKAPLSFSRISSGFTYARKHPIYKTVRPHTGVDYAAPTGTPVMAIGDGVVIQKGYKGGGGHTVKIRHNSTYESAYLHLSKYGKGIEVGKRVAQGEVIGYVGSTGASTGPHLDFRIWMNGHPINPLTMEAPPTEPIPAQYMAEYDSVKTQIIKSLE